MTGASPFQPPSLPSALPERRQAPPTLPTRGAAPQRAWAALQRRRIKTTRRRATTSPWCTAGCKTSQPCAPAWYATTPAPCSLPVRPPPPAPCAPSSCASASCVGRRRAAARDRQRRARHAGARGGAAARRGGVLPRRLSLARRRRLRGAPGPPAPPTPTPRVLLRCAPAATASFAPSERPERHAAEQPGALQTDRARAAELYARAACQRHVGALLSLGACRYHGLGVSRDPAGAFRAYQVATPRQGTRATWRMRGRAP